VDFAVLPREAWWKFAIRFFVLTNDVVYYWRDVRVVVNWG